MKEFVYHIAEEEKLPLIINRILSSPDDQFVIFAKDSRSFHSFMNLCKKYKIPFSYLFSSHQQSSAFKNYNEKKSKLFIVSDTIWEKKSFFIPAADQIIHFDVPAHPLTYQKRNRFIKNKKFLRLIHIYCTEKEYQDFRAIEVYFDKNFIKGKVLEKDLKLPPEPKKILSKKTKKTFSRKSTPYSRKKSVAMQEISAQSETIGIGKKIKIWIQKLFRKLK